jgi:peptidoglycan/LPS O-acetylase OafA/YrhL
MQKRLRPLDTPPSQSATAGVAVFRRTGRLRNIAAFLAALAVLIQIWLPLVHPPERIAIALAPTLARTAFFFGDRLALCLAGAKERPGSPIHTPALSCPICLAAQHLTAFVPPAAGAVLANSLIAEPAGYIAPTLIVVRPLDPTSQPRPPPPTA